MEKNLANPVVTSVGNSWVVCRSKSHPGRIYYFNTYTGEAAWNLSEVEIEKAKKTTKIIENSGVNMDGCPEPKDPPLDNPNQNYHFNRNLQIVKNSDIFTNKVLSDPSKQTKLVAPFGSVQCCNHINQLGHVGLSIPISSGLNANIWNVPVPQQLLVPNSVSPVINQPQYHIDVPQNFNINEVRYVETTSIPLHQRFEQQKNVSNDDSSTSTGSILRKFNLSLGNSSYKNDVGDNKDLRQLLSRKRNHDYSMTDKKIPFNKHRLGGEIPKQTDYQQEDISGSKTVKAAFNSTVFQKKRKIDVSRLKTIAKINDSQDLWYILADANIFMYHYQFLKILLDSDDECHLMVMEKVIDDILCLNRSQIVHINKLSRIAKYFIFKNIKAGKATVVRDDPTMDRESNIYILDCYLKFLEENCNIVLLCNNTKLHIHEKAVNIPIYTVNEIKSILNNDIVEKYVPNKMASNLIDSRKISITIPNAEALLDNQNLSEVDSIVSNKDINCKNSNVNLKTRTVECQEKTTFDIGIQTDANIGKSFHTIATQTTLNFNPQDKNLLTPVKSKPIKLTRTLSNQSSKKEDTEKRNFKWRRKRSANHLENNETQGQESTAMDSISNELMEKRPRLMDLNEEQPDNVYNSEQASANDRDNLSDIAEETTNVIETTKSTEIITNKPNIENEGVTKVMFEVTGQVMEEYLKIRSDEWISRFLQIMEEALTQVLQKDPRPHSLSPPWTLHEAAQCIKKLYLTNYDVVGGVDKLSDILTKSSDRKGKVDIHMEPEQFMKMYSYGVHLIDSLQVVNSENEDIQSAAESLAQLLNDIQNPNADTSHNDVFTDVPLDNSIYTSTNSEDINTAVVTCEEQEQHSNLAATLSTERNPSGSEVERNRSASNVNSARRLQHHSSNLSDLSKYNLRSQWKRSFKNCRPATPNQFFRVEDQESEFFNSLSLRKNGQQFVNANENIDDNPCILATSSPVHTNTENRVEKEPNISPRIEQPEVEKPSEQKIIRNFTKVLDFESKIIDKESELILLDISDREDLCYDYDSREEELSDYDKFSEEMNEAIDKESETKAPIPSQTYNLKMVFEKVIREIREAFLVVYAFCDESRKRLKEAGPSDELHVLRKARETHSTVINLCSALKCIKNRDYKDMENFVVEFLKLENNTDLTFDENDFQEYRDLITKCIDQADLLRESVEYIMSYSL